MRIGLLLFVLMCSGTAYADEDVPLHIKNGGALDTGKTQLQLPPGYYLSEALWLKLDTEVKRLQDVETRLVAENTSLRESVASTTSPSIYLVGLSLLAGIALGAWIAY